MRNHRSFVQRALEAIHKITPKRPQIAPLALMLGIAVTLLTSALGPATPVRAADPPNPAARLQVIIHKIHIHDDRAWFGGNLLQWEAHLCATDNDGGCSGIGSDVYNGFSFHASSSDDVYPEYLMPTRGDTIVGDATVEAGIPVYAGQRYLFKFDIHEFAISDGDQLGYVHGLVNQETDWGVGTHTVKSSAGDGDDGDFTVTYEIRRIGLPDLRMGGFQVNALPGQPTFICGQVINAGDGPSGPIKVTLRSEGVDWEIEILPSLEQGASTWKCTERKYLLAKKHYLEYRLDDENKIPEIYDYNNTATLTVEADPVGLDPNRLPPTPMPSPEPKPTATPTGSYGSKADLTVKAIKIHDHMPDGKDDCAIGRNAVTVVVKNGGKGDAGSFTVRLTVDGDDDIDATVDGLGTGEEREVAFDNVQMKKGQHTLKAVADPEHAVAEGKDDNNGLKVNARCTEAAS